jgi:hypothetical protein
MKRALLVAVLAAATMGAVAAAAQTAGTSLSPGARNTGLVDRSPDRKLPGDGTGKLNDRLPDRELPKLQDRDDISSAPSDVRDRFAGYCKTRGGCPGGYAQHQAGFMDHEQKLKLKERQDLERRLQRDLQQGKLMQ